MASSRYCVVNTRFSCHGYFSTEKFRDPASAPSASGLAKLRFARFSPFLIWEIAPHSLRLLGAASQI